MSAAPRSCQWSAPDCFEPATQVVVTVNRRTGTVADDRIMCDEHAATASYVPAGDEYVCRVSLITGNSPKCRECGVPVSRPAPLDLCAECYGYAMTDGWVTP